MAIRQDEVAVVCHEECRWKLWAFWWFGMTLLSSGMFGSALVAKREMGQGQWAAGFEAGRAHGR